MYNQKNIKKKLRDTLKKITIDFLMFDVPIAIPILTIIISLLGIIIIASPRKDIKSNTINSNTIIDTCKYEVYYEYNIYNQKDTIPVDTILKIKKQ